MPHHDTREPDTLARELGIPFNDAGLLRLAFTHSSYVNENPSEGGGSNERLEFLGDALIGLVVAERVYAEHPSRREGALTSMRAALVQDETLARVSRSLGLGRHLLMGRGELGSGGRERGSNLAGLFEALAAAVYLDQGYEAARGFVLRSLSGEMGALSDPAATPRNAKSQLQETLQARGREPPTYRIVAVSGRDHARTFTAEVLADGEPLARGSGPRKSAAEREAARVALERLGECDEV